MRPVLREFFCAYDPCCRLVVVRSELDQRLRYCSKRCKHLDADKRYRERMRFAKEKNA